MLMTTQDAYDEMGGEQNRLNQEMNRETDTANTTKSNYLSETSCNETTGTGSKGK